MIKYNGLIPLISGLLMLSGCSLHTFVPANRFDLPETHEKWLWGNAEVRYEGTTRIELIPDITAAPPLLNSPKIEPEGLILNDMGFSVSTGIVKHLDIFLKMPVAPSPTLLGAKYQFLGHSYDKRKQGDWDFSVTLAGGYTRQEADTQNAGVQSHYSGQAWAFDGALLGGNRLQRNILIYGGPFYTLLAADGAITQLNQVYNTSGRGSQFGVNLGCAYEIGPYNIVIELAYISLNWSYSQMLNQIYGGLALSREF